MFATKIYFHAPVQGPACTRMVPQGEHCRTRRALGSASSRSILPFRFTWTLLAQDTEDNVTTSLAQICLLRNKVSTTQVLKIGFRNMHTTKLTSHCPCVWQWVWSGFSQWVWWKSWRCMRERFHPSTACSGLQFRWEPPATPVKRNLLEVLFLNFQRTMCQPFHLDGVPVAKQSTCFVLYRVVRSACSGRNGAWFNFRKPKPILGMSTYTKHSLFSTIDKNLQFFTWDLEQRKRQETKNYLGVQNGLRALTDVRGVTQVQGIEEPGIHSQHPQWAFDKKWKQFFESKSLHASWWHWNLRTCQDETNGLEQVKFSRECLSYFLARSLIEALLQQNEIYSLVENNVNIPEQKKITCDINQGSAFKKDYFTWQILDEFEICVVVNDHHVFLIWSHFQTELQLLQCSVFQLEKAGLAELFLTGLVAGWSSYLWFWIASLGGAVRRVRLSLSLGLCCRGILGMTAAVVILLHFLYGLNWWSWNASTESRRRVFTALVNARGFDNCKRKQHACTAMFSTKVWRQAPWQRFFSDMCKFLLKSRSSWANFWEQLNRWWQQPDWCVSDRNKWTGATRSVQLDEHL